MTDLELVERARAGATDAFGALVDRHRGAVYRAALAALGGNEADADDVAQETFAIAFERLHQFRGEASVKTWLLKIAWRKALTRRRQIRWRWLSRFVSLGATDARFADEIAAAMPSPERVLLDAERLDIMRRIVKALPAAYRDALLLVATGDSSYEDAAAVLGVKVGTLKWRVNDARRQLRERLRDRGFEDV